MISTELLRRYPFFNTLDPKQLNQIAMISEMASYQADEDIFKEHTPADTLMLLTDGCVHLYFLVTDSVGPNIQKEFFIQEINPGEVFGISAIIEPHEMSATARTCKVSQVIEIDAVALRKLMDEDPKLALNMIKQAARTVKDRLYAVRVQLAAAWQG
jgi:CRP/FNR family transcriptional regulator, cyclic AMP receptor protein